MRCEVTEDPNAFWDLAHDFLVADPVLNTIPLTLVALRRDGRVTDPEAPTFVTVCDDSGTVVGVALRTPPRNAHVSMMPAEAVAAVVDGMRRACPGLPGVSGTTAEATRFAELWCAGGGARPEVEMRQRIHRLGSLHTPAGVPGGWRAATCADEDLVTGWSTSFAFEVGGHVSTEDERRRTVRLAIAERRAYLWEDDLGDGHEPVSYVGTSPCVAGVARVGPVYTPPQRRSRGYAGALVAAVSGNLVADGAANVCLYTDLANPTSNKIYAQVGYQPVCDATAYRFVPGG